VRGVGVNGAAMISPITADSVSLGGDTA